MNMLANLSTMGIFPEAQLLAAQIAAASLLVGQPGLIRPRHVRCGGPGWSGGCFPDLGSTVKKDEENFNPAVLNDVE